VLHVVYSNGDKIIEDIGLHPKKSSFFDVASNLERIQGSSVSSHIRKLLPCYEFDRKIDLSVV
jgi:hypothetical protein